MTRLARLACAFLLVAITCGRLQAASAQDGLDGETYVDESFGFTVTWPEDTYDPEVGTFDDGTPFGVYLRFDGGFGLVAGFQYDSLRACINDPAASLEALDGISDFEETDEIETPDLVRDFRSSFFTYHYQPEDSDTESTHYTFIGCTPMVVDGEEVPDVYLYVEFGDNTDDFEANFPTFIDVVNGIALSGEATPDDNGADTGDDGNGLSDTGYIDPTYHFGVEFDTDLDPRILENSDGDQTGVVFGTDYSMAVKSWQGSRARTCINDEIDIFAEDALGDVDDADDDIDLPDSPDAERSSLVEMTYTGTEDDEVQVLLYVECRPMMVEGEEVEDVFLQVTFLSASNDWDDNLPVLQDVLDSLTFDAEADANQGNDSDQDPAADGTFTSTLGYALTWDADAWTYAPLNEDQPEGGFTLSRAEAIITVQAAADPTLDDCVDAEIGVVEQLDGMGNLTRERDAESLEPGSDSESTFQSGTVELSNGDTPIYVYVECRPLSGEIDGNPLALVIRMIVVQDSYEDLRPELQSMLDDIEITDAKG